MYKRQVGGLSHLGELMFHQKTLHKTWCMSRHIVMMKLPIAHSCSFLNHLNSFLGGIFKLNTKFDADLLLYSVILNATATQYTCSLNGIYCPHWLVLWSRHCSHMCIPVPSLWLAARLHQWSANHSLYINNGWTFSRQTLYVFLVILLIQLYFKFLDLN